MVSYLDEMDHGIFEEDKIHGASTHSLVVLLHERLQLLIQHLQVVNLHIQDNVNIDNSHRSELNIQQHN